jgi:hypothetical protein
MTKPKVTVKTERIAGDKITTIRCGRALLVFNGKDYLDVYAGGFFEEDISDFFAAVDALKKEMGK